MAHEPMESGRRRGCLAIGVVAVLILMLAVAISLGWIGQIDRGKISGLPLPAGNTT